MKLKKIALFGGTSEEHLLIHALAPYTDLTVCVASEYAYQLLGEYGNKITVHVGRMDADEMIAFFTQEKFEGIVDSTHPYAVLVTENLKKASGKLDIPYYRLCREKSSLDGCKIVSSATQAADFLSETVGNVLLTTGSKELAVFTSIPNFSERIYPRVLPCVDSIQSCAQLGYASSHIIAMQGPFSQLLNEAMMEQFSIAYMVTKESGNLGGFPEKILAAQSKGVLPIVITRTDDSGTDLEKIISEILTTNTCR